MDTCYIVYCSNSFKYMEPLQPLATKEVHPQSIAPPLNSRKYPQWYIRIRQIWYIKSIGLLLEPTSGRWQCTRLVSTKSVNRCIIDTNGFSFHADDESFRRLNRSRNQSASPEVLVFVTSFSSNEHIDDWVFRFLSNTALGTRPVNDAYCLGFQE